jgi:Txe/YoeB family toxin of Txe-Axe toxin-antitoxin module
MNNFTKKELEAIKYWCRENHDLVDKIQSMIDNYCEHLMGINIENGKKECMKCGGVK